MQKIIFIWKIIFIIVIIQPQPPDRISFLVNAFPGTNVDQYKNDDDWIQVERDKNSKRKVADGNNWRQEEAKGFQVPVNNKFDTLNEFDEIEGQEVKSEEIRPTSEEENRLKGTVGKIRNDINEKDVSKGKNDGDLTKNRKRKKDRRKVTSENSNKSQKEEVNEIFIPAVNKISGEKYEHVDFDEQEIERGKIYPKEENWFKESVRKITDAIYQKYKVGMDKSRTEEIHIPDNNKVATIKEIEDSDKQTMENEVVRPKWENKLIETVEKEITNETNASKSKKDGNLIKNRLDNNDSWKMATENSDKKQKGVEEIQVPDDNTFAALNQIEDVEKQELASAELLPKSETRLKDSIGKIMLQRSTMNAFKENMEDTKCKYLNKRDKQKLYRKLTMRLGESGKLSRSSRPAKTLLENILQNQKIVKKSIKAAFLAYLLYSVEFIEVETDCHAIHEYDNFFRQYYAGTIDGRVKRSAFPNMDETENVELKVDLKKCVCEFIGASKYIMERNGIEDKCFSRNASFLFEIFPSAVIWKNIFYS